MSSDFLRCCVCYSEYDLQERTAVVLSQCGHNVCQFCTKKILENKRECPVCRKKFSTDHSTLYAPNRQIKEQLEKDNQYEKCAVHTGYLLEFYCKTDKTKICLECHFTKGEGGHKGHDVERIVDFKDELETKRKIFEVKGAKYQAMYDEGKSLLGKRRQEQLDNFKSVERITKLVVFEAFLGIKTVFDEEESKLEEQYGADSSLRQEIEAKINQYSDIKKADFSVILDEDAEKLAEEFDKPELAECFENLRTQNTMESISMPQIIQDESTVNIEATTRLPKTNLKGYLSFSIDNGTLTITANDVLNKDVCADLDKWEKAVKGINVVFDKFNFNKDDLFLLEYIWLKLQPQIHHLGLEYRNTKNSDLMTKFEDHLYAFPNTIFSHPKYLKTIDLKFVEAKGSDRYTRLLTERYLAEAHQLTSLNLTYEGTDLTDNTFRNLMKNSEALLKGLVQFSLVLKTGKALSLDYCIALPNLKEFTLKSDISYISIVHKIFINHSLKSMKSLRKCEIELKNDGMQINELNQLLTVFSKRSELGTLKIAIPDLEVTQAKFDELSDFIKRNMKEPKDVKLTLKIAVAHNGLNFNAGNPVNRAGAPRYRELETFPDPFDYTQPLLPYYDFNSGLDEVIDYPTLNSGMQRTNVLRNALRRRRTANNRINANNAANTRQLNQNEPEETDPNPYLSGNLDFVYE